LPGAGGVLPGAGCAAAGTSCAEPKLAPSINAPNAPANSRTNWVGLGIGAPLPEVEWQRARPDAADNHAQLHRERPMNRPFMPQAGEFPLILRLQRGRCSDTNHSFRDGTGGGRSKRRDRDSRRSIRFNRYWIDSMKPIASNGRNQTLGP